MSRSATSELSYADWPGAGGTGSGKGPPSQPDNPGPSEADHLALKTRQVYASSTGSGGLACTVVSPGTGGPRQVIGPRARRPRQQTVGAPVAPSTGRENRQTGVEQP